MSEEPHNKTGALLSYHVSKVVMDAVLAISSMSSVG